MKANIIRIGNSRGIRIPKSILKQCRLEDEIEIYVEDGKVIIKAIDKNPRKGWENRFMEMHDRGDDSLLIDEGVDAKMDNWEW